MRLDSSALSTLNIFPLEKVKDKISSVFGLLNVTITAGMGERLLRRWLRQPLVRKDDINQRLDLVELFIDSSELREELRSTALKGIVDIDRYVRRLETKTRFRLQDLYVMYQTVKKLNSILECLKRCDHPHKGILETAFITPLEELVNAFDPFIQLTENVIDAKSLSLSPPEFNIAPNFDDSLREIANRKNEAYDEIARIFDMVCG